MSRQCGWSFCRNTLRMPEMLQCQQGFMAWLRCRSNQTRLGASAVLWRLCRCFAAYRKDVDNLLIFGKLFEFLVERQCPRDVQFVGKMAGDFHSTPRKRRFKDQGSPKSFFFTPKGTISSFLLSSFGILWHFARRSPVLSILNAMIRLTFFLNCGDMKSIEACKTVWQFDIEMLCSQRGKMARFINDQFHPWGQGRSQDSCLVFDGRLRPGLAALRVCPNASEFPQFCLKAEMYAHMSITGPESSLVYLDLFRLFASLSRCMQQCNHHATASACFFRPAKAWSSNAVLPYTKWSAAFWVDQAWRHKLDVMLRGMLWHLEDWLFSPVFLVTFWHSDKDWSAWA